MLDCEEADLQNWRSGNKTRPGEVQQMSQSVEALIDLDRYPISEPGSGQFNATAAKTRSELTNNGCGCLPGFLSQAGLSQMVDEARSLAPSAAEGMTQASPYFFSAHIEDLETYPIDHPLRHKGERKLGQVAGDLIPEGSALRALHGSRLMTDFLAAVMGVPDMYPGADKYQALNISVMPPGGCQQWHFDHGDMTTTLMLQKPESGGEFQFAPNIRSNEDENYGEVARILAGDLAGCETISMEPGTLMLFRGLNSLHRVNRVAGKQTRILAILSYNPEPGVEGIKQSSIESYGERADGGHSPH